MKTPTEIAERLREIARGVYVTNAIRAAQISVIADEVERIAPPMTPPNQPPSASSDADFLVQLAQQFYMFSGTRETIIRIADRLRAKALDNPAAFIGGKAGVSGEHDGTGNEIVQPTGIPESLETSLQREMSRIRNEVMPVYQNIPTGVLAVAMMKQDLLKASAAIAERDSVAMLQAQETLKGYSL